MDDTELIDSIKTRLGITGTYHDDTILAYVEDVKAFMLSGGVATIVIDSNKSIGVIARGVADLWNYGAGDGKFSEIFYQRMTQLRLLRYSNEGDVTTGDIIPITKEEIDECTGCLDD